VWLTAQWAGFITQVQPNQAGRLPAIYMHMERQGISATKAAAAPAQASRGDKSPLLDL